MFLAQPQFSWKGNKSLLKWVISFVFSPSEPKSKGRILYQGLTIVQGREATNFATEST